MAKKIEKTQPSSVCRVNKNSNYTVMSNFHLRSKTLSLKAVGLLSKVLSLTDEWDYSVAGLASICKEGESAIKSALAELKARGYLTVTKLKPNQTKSGRIEYVYDFYEYSAKDDPNSPEYDDGNGDKNGDSTTNVESSKKIGFQAVEKQGIENLPLEILPVEIQPTENQGQLNNNNKILKNQILMNQISINQSSAETAVEPVESPKEIDGLIDDYLQEQKVYTQIVKENIDYENYAEWINEFVTDGSMSIQELDEIVAIIVRAVCSRKKKDIICGQEFPHEVIKSALLRADRDCIENTLDTMKKTDDIRNVEKYFISTLFNEVNNHNFRSNNESRWAEYAVKRDFGY